MRSIKAKFKKIQNRNPFLGDYICFAQAVKGKKFSRKALVQNFKKLVSTDEYQQDERKELIDHLYSLTNMLEEGEIVPINHSGTIKNTMSLSYYLVE